MRVDLRRLQPNPMRDFVIDPIDDETVERLRLSIEQDGFWGGIVVRRLPHDIFQIAAGHHRVEAALKVGITTADLFVAEGVDDASMIRVYARENATQRGMSSTALTGTVAAALKYLAKVILTGTGLAPEIRRNFDLPTVRRRLLGEDGMGREVLLAFLEDIPGIHKATIDQQLANLKASGDYARLIAEVEREIAHDHPDAEAQTLAQQATEEAAKHQRIFDFEGIARHLKNAHQVNVYRGLVTRPAVREILPVEEQAPLAAMIVKKARERPEPREVSGEFLRENFSLVLHEARQAQRALSAEEEERLEREDRHYAMNNNFTKFRRSLDGITRAGAKIADLLRTWPPDEPPPAISVEFRESLQEAAFTIQRLFADERFRYANAYEKAEDSPSDHRR